MIGQRKLRGGLAPRLVAQIRLITARGSSGREIGKLRAGTITEREISREPGVDCRNARASGHRPVRTRSGRYSSGSSSEVNGRARKSRLWWEPACRRVLAASRRAENPPGAGIDRSHARRTSKGREGIDDGIPFASQSHHFPNLLFCGPLHGVHCGQRTPAQCFGVRNKGTAELPAEPAIPGETAKRNRKGDFRGPNAQWRASSCPSRGCIPWPCPG